MYLFKRSKGLYSGTNTLRHINKDSLTIPKDDIAMQQRRVEMMKPFSML